MIRRQVALRYVGFHCFGETNEISGSDEPYFVFGMVPAPLNGGQAQRTRIYEDIDAGRSVGDDITLYTGAPLGLALSVSLFEHDEGDPDAFKDNVEKAVDIAHDKGVEALVEIPAAGPVLAVLGTIASIFTGPALTHAHQRSARKRRRRRRHGLAHHVDPVRHAAAGSCSTPGLGFGKSLANVRARRVQC